MKKEDRLPKWASFIIIVIVIFGVGIAIHILTQPQETRRQQFGKYDNRKMSEPIDQNLDKGILPAAYGASDNNKDKKDRKVSSDSILDKLRTDISSLISKAKIDIRALSTFSDSFSTTYTLNDGQLSPDQKWKCLYKSEGVVESKNGVLRMAPRAATSVDKTHACLLLSTKTFKNFQFDCDMKTVKQLRTGSPANAWETAWLFFRFTDEQPKSNHHYYFTMKPNGYEFGKKDNAPGDNTLEQQVFLKTGNPPALKIGTSNHITIIAKDFHFTVKVDNVTVVDMDDTPKDRTKMAQGLIGFYTEDADVTFDNVKVVET